MRRRELSGGAGALFAPADAGSLVRPRALQAGDTVGLITPSTYVSDPDRLELAARTIRYFGLRMKKGRNVGRRAGYLGGTVAERLDDLHQMFPDPEVKAVFAIRGGYGSEQLLDRIDYDLIRRNPKIFLGYSDITALHLAIRKRTGPGDVPRPRGALAIFRLYAAVFPQGAVFAAADGGGGQSARFRPAAAGPHGAHHTAGGKARGPLAGGNLSLISTTMGTPWEIETARPHPVPGGRGRAALFDRPHADPTAPGRQTGRRGGYRVRGMPRLPPARLSSRRSSRRFRWGKCSTRFWAG